MCIRDSLITALFEQYDILYMWGVREHIDWLDGCHLIIYVHHLEVASLCGRVATYIDDALRGCVQDDLDDIRVHTGTRWVGDDDVWATMLSDEVVGEDILHIACIEEGIGDVVYLGVDLGILDSLRYILNADNLTCLACHEAVSYTHLTLPTILLV